MKSTKKLAMTAALATALASPLAGAAQGGGFDGFVSAGVGLGTTDLGYSSAYYEDGSLISQGGFSNDANNIYVDFRATAAYQDKSGFGGQMDYVYLYDDQDFDLGGNVALSTTDIAGHVFYRGGDWLLGGLAQKRTFDMESDPKYPIPVKVTVWGVEGQKQVGSNMSFYGQLGYQTINGYGDESTGWIGAVEGRYFVHDNFVVNGKFTYGKVDNNFSHCPGCPGNEEYKKTAVEVGGEYRLANSNLSMFAKYVWSKDEDNYLDIHNDGSPVLTWTGNGEATNHQVMIGLKLNFGKESLRQRDREGASLNPMTLMKLFGGPA